MAYNYTGDLTVSNTTTTNNLVVKNGMSDIYLNWSANYANNASPLDIAINKLSWCKQTGVWSCSWSNY